MHATNLKEKLLREAKRTIEENGLESLTMRNLGSALGVSRTAPYKHFKNKADLLSSIAEDGFKNLDNIFKSIINKQNSTKESIKELYYEYYNFALNNPACYRLMYGHEIIEQDKTKSLKKAAESAFKTAMEVIIKGQKNNEIKKADPISLTNAAWAMLHGFTIANLDRQLISPNIYPTLINNENETDDIDLNIYIDSILFGILK